MIIKILLACLILLFLVNSHYSHGVCQPPSNIRALKIKVGYPITNFNEGRFQLTYMRDTVAVYFYKMFFVYRLSEVRISDTDEKIPGTESYFVYHNSDSIGYFFASPWSETFSRIPVDSILLYRGYKGTHFGLPDMKYWRGETKRGKDETIVKYWLVDQRMKAEHLMDTIYYHYSSLLDNYPFTISDSISQAVHSKIYKVVLIYNRKYIASQKAFIPKREYNFEVEKLEDFDSVFLKGLIERVERENR